MRTLPKLLRAGLALGLAIAATVAVVPLSQAVAADVTSIYASPTGSGATCSQAAPCSVQQAQLKARELAPTMAANIEITLAGGTYQLTTPLVLSALDSGQNGHRIVWKGASAQKPVISGGTTISGWTQTSRPGLWSAPVSNSLQTRQLYANGVRIPRASGPSPVGLTMNAAKTGYTASTSAMASWRNPQDIDFIYTKGLGSWTQPRCGVASISGTTITMKQPCISNMQLPMSPIEPGTENNPSGGWPPLGDRAPDIVENAFELLTPGRWYLDRTEHKVYYMAAQTDNVPTITFTAPVLEQLIVSSASPDDPIHDVSFTGLDFSYTTWLQPSGNDGFVEMIDNATLTGPGAANSQGTCSYSEPDGTCPFGNWTRQLAAVDLQGTRNVEFTGNVFQRLGGAGLGLHHGAKDDVIKGNEITDVSGNGMIVGSYDASLPNVTTGEANLALGRPASQSSTAFGGSAARAVDGNRDGNWDRGSITSTSNDIAAWWQVDLGSAQRLSSVQIANRTDCCSNRLSDYWVFVSTTPFNTALTPAQQAAQPGVWSNHQTAQAGSPTKIPADVRGRYVMVQQSGTQYLSLAEVEVLAPVVTNLAEGKPATQSSTTAYGGVASRAVDGKTDGVFSNGSVTDTGPDANAWWQVDLGASKPLWNIDIYNRTDCCASRLSDYWVFVSDTPFNTALTPTQQAAAPGVWSSHQTSQAGTPTTVKADVKGRYVMVQQNSAQILSLAEVKVSSGASMMDGVTVSNNAVHHIGVEYIGAAGIQVVYARNTKVIHNQVNDVPYSGINFGWGGNHSSAIAPEANPTINRDNLIGYNMIYRTMLKLVDGGAIYTSNTQGPSLEHGLTMRGNVAYVEPGGINAYYSDRGSNYTTIDGNVQYFDREYFNGGCVTTGHFVIKNNYYSSALNGYICINRGTDFVAEPNNVKIPLNPGPGVVPNAILATAGLEADYRALTTARAPSVNLVSGVVGGKVLITGSGFTPASTVTLGGVAATQVEYLSSNYLIATVGTSTGHLRVTTTAGISPETALDVTGVNLAEGKPATESSDPYGALAFRAVDGLSDDYYSATGNDLNAWWKVDLTSSQAIKAINVFNRTNCCSDRLTDYWVFVSNTPFDTSLTPTQQAAKPGVWSSHQTGTAGSPTNIPAPTSGRYVMVQLAGTNYLTISELQVIAQ
jgi:hypothetical protein